MICNVSITFQIEFVANWKKKASVNLWGLLGSLNIPHITHLALRVRFFFLFFYCKCQAGIQAKPILAFEWVSCHCMTSFNVIYGILELSPWTLQQWMDHHSHSPECVHGKAWTSDRNLWAAQSRQLFPVQCRTPAEGMILSEWQRESEMPSREMNFDLCWRSWSGLNCKENEKHLLDFTTSPVGLT